MRYNKIRKMDISDGPGIRVSIFLQGCEFHCPNCFNPETWDFEKGTEFTEETVEEVMELCKKPGIKGLSILGGEPLHPRNIQATEMLAKKFKQLFPQKNLWVWSGYTFENYIAKQEVTKYIDVIVDGQYKEELHDPQLEWRGSSNQRVIDVQKSLNEGKVITVV